MIATRQKSAAFRPVASYTDLEIQLVALGTPGEIADWVQSTALQRGITRLDGPIERFAHAVSRLSGDEVILDQVEELLLALSEAGVISSSQLTLLHWNYVRTMGAAGS